MPFRPIGALYLKGKSQAVEAHEPAADFPSGAIEDYLAAYACLNDDRLAARKCFVQFLARYPDDPLGAFHLARLMNGETGTEIRIA